MGTRPKGRGRSPDKGDVGHDLPEPASAPLQEQGQTPENPIGVIASDSAPLRAEHYEQVAAARRRGRALRRAASVARSSGRTTAFFAALSLLGGLFSPVGIVLGLGMGLIAWNELSGAKLLRCADPRAPRVLGHNQLAFMALLIGYGAWGMYKGLTTPMDPALAQVPQAGAAFSSLAELQTMIVVGIYGSVIAGSVLFQGSMALYYFTRARHVRKYRERTPAWIIELQKAA